MISSFLYNIKQFTLLKIEPKDRSLVQTFLFYLICIAEIVLILCFVPIAFANNDDTTMNAIASGAMSGTPSEYLMFSNIVIGHILTFLYTALSEINWYAWYLIAAFSFGYIFIQYFFFRITHGWLKNIIIHLVILAFLYPNLLQLQFTKIAAIGLAGGFLHVLYSSKEKNYLNMIPGMLLIITGALIRKEVFYMYLVLSLPFLLMTLIDTSKKTMGFSAGKKDAPKSKFDPIPFRWHSFFLRSKKYSNNKDSGAATAFGLSSNHRKKIHIVSAIAIIISFAAIAFDNYQYAQNPNFQKYRRFNELRSTITTHDNPSFIYENYKSVLQNVGWDKADYNVAANFNIDVGHPKFDIAILSQIAENLNSSSNSAVFSIFLSKVYSTIRSVIRYIVLSPANILIVFILLTWHFIWGDKKKILLAAYLIYITVILLILTMIADGALKERIIWNFIFPLFLLSLVFTICNTKLFKNKIPRSLRKRNILPLILMVLSGIMITLNTHNAIISNKESRMSDSRVATYISGLPLDFYVSWCNLDSYNPFDLPYDHQKQYSLGWLAGSPFNKEKIKKYTGKEGKGIYTIFNKDIVWIFRNNFFYKKAKYHEKVKDFYLHNYKNTKINMDILPVNEKDTLYKYTFFIPRP